MDTKIKIPKIKKEGNFFFPVVFAIVFILVLSISFSNLLMQRSEKSIAQDCSMAFRKGISVSTDKIKYGEKEKIFLNVVNSSQYSIFFEPCDLLNVFEKKVGDSWVLQDRLETSSAESYKNDFEKKSGDVQCDIEVPKSGPGIYRSVIPIFYDCREPSRYACQRSEIFYSNEFEVTGADANQ